MVAQERRENEAENGGYDAVKRLNYEHDYFHVKTDRVQSEMSCA